MNQAMLAVFERHTRKEGDCLIWTGGKDRRGYGILSEPKTRKPRRAAREAYKLWVGPIPDGLFVCHHCDNPPCVNPEHLFVGTPLENMQDKMAKGRHRSLHDLANPQTKIPHSERNKVREMLASGATQQEAAKLFGISQSRVSQIWNRIDCPNEQ